MSQTTLAIPKPQNSFKQVKPKTIVGKGENHYVQQEQQQAQHPRGQGRYEQVQDLTSREAGSVGGQMVKKMIESYEKNL